MRSLSFLRSSSHAKTVHRYCHIFLAVDLVLICVVVYTWYSLCEYRFCTAIPRKSRTNVLAFGDSMTRGFVKRSLYYPYSESLERTLNRLHSRKVVFVVDNGGVNGDTAVGTAAKRLRETLAKKRYEWVIILMGTNDLFRLAAGVDEVFSSIKKLCEIALKEHRMLILGTVTARQCENDSFYVPVCDSFVKNRQILNKKIRSYVASSQQMVLLADFDKDLDYMGMSKSKRKKYWQDNVHLTETGYEYMAKLVYKKMRPYLPATVHQWGTRKNETMLKV